MLGGYIFFSSDPGLVSLSGAVVALCGMSFYTYLNFQGSKELLLRQNSLSQKPKTNIDDEKVETGTAASV